MQENRAREEKLDDRIRQLVERQKSLINKISRIEVEADSIAQELDQLIGERDLPAGLIRREKKQQFKLLRDLAEEGVSSLDIRPRSDGLSDVRIEQGKVFTLPPALADLLYVLALDSGRAGDGLVGFKTITEVMILLHKKAGREFTRRSVAQNIFRLRNELRRRAGANPFLIQTNRRLGFRFALRRRTESVIRCDE
ncbi:MAG: hypothetical protein AB1631_03620 [Acidobacteriota bacterium]